MSVTIVVCIIGWIAGWVLIGRARTVDRLRSPAPGAAARVGLEGVSIVIPARNEASSIGSLLEGITARRDDPAGARRPGAPERIVVVDDGSTDGTAHLAAGFAGVEVITAPALPDGWTGKSWACQNGVQHLGGNRSDQDVLLFLDADVRTDRTALAAVVAERDRVGGLVSVQPWHDTERWYEQLSALFNVIAIMGTAANSPRGPSGAFGPVLATSRSDYDLVGGHGSVRDEVVEDLALAARYRAGGRPVSTLQGGRSIRFRMYPDGLRQLAEGWTKNFAAGANSTRMGRLSAIVLWVTSVGSAALAPFDATRGAMPVIAAASLYLAFALQLGSMFAQVGRFRPLTALLFPVVVVVFVAIFVRSLYRTHVRHSVVWRGRAISTATRRG